MQKIKGRIVEIFGSQKEFSKALGVSEVTVSNKLKNLQNLTHKDIIAWSNALQLEREEILDYFF